jgi:hypothetical protein
MLYVTCYITDVSQFRGLRVIYNTGFGLADWIYWHFIHITRDYRQYGAITDLRTLQFTFAHAQELSAFTSRILATGFQQSHCHFNSHMESSFHSQIPFLPLFCSYQFRRLDSIRFDSIPPLPSSYPGRLASRNSTYHFRLLFRTGEHFCITTVYGPRREHSLYC